MKRVFLECAALVALLGCVNACEREARSSERESSTVVKGPQHDAGLPPSNGAANEVRDVEPPSGATTPSTGRDAGMLRGAVLDIPDGVRDSAPAAPLQMTGGSGGTGGTVTGGTGGTVTGGSGGTGGTVTGGTGGTAAGGSGGTGGTVTGGTGGTVTGGSGGTGGTVTGGAGGMSTGAR